ncbi:MAG: endonuclease/exonuclease/phosphatase family protein [Sulfitobacter sp.]
MQAETLRIATFNAELIRKGPGLLLRDILRGDDPQIAAFRALMLEVKPDIIALQGIDHDLRGTALRALNDDLGAAGLSYPHMYTATSNAGQDSGLDLNGNGKLGDADDSHGYGRFSGMGAMAILSRYPVLSDEIEDYTSLLWKDLAGNIYPINGGHPFGGPAVFDTHRLSSRGHWVVPVQTPMGKLRVMTFHATPPLYDGAEDRNGRRNHDETAFWLDYLDRNPTTGPFALMGTANTDPERGSGRPEAINALLADPRFQNPFDSSPTADFDEPLPGDLRVDYLLPSAGLRVIAHGRATDIDASRHSLLWVDITLPRP